MQLNRRALARLMLCLGTSLSLVGCASSQHVADFLATPPDRLVCDQVGPRPKIPPEYVIDWSKVTSVAEAQTEHQKYVASVRTREGIVAAYILQVEGVNFVCFNNMQWRKNYEADLAKTHTPVYP